MDDVAYAVMERFKKANMVATTNPHTMIDEERLIHLSRVYADIWKNCQRMYRKL